MKNLILLLSFFLSSLQSLAAPLACEDKLLSLEEQGIHRGAFLQALKNVGRDSRPSRYLLMAHLGREQEGEMKMVDMHTGRVKVYKMWHGYPENHGQMLDHNHTETTYFGGLELKLDEDDFRKLHRIRTAPISPSLRNKLTRDGVLQNQQLLKCSDRFRKNPKRSESSKNDPCLDPKDVDEVFKALKDEERQAMAGDDKRPLKRVMFVYPTRNLDNYLRQVKLQNDEPDVCKFLEKMPTPSRANGNPPAGRTAPTESQR